MSRLGVATVVLILALGGLSGCSDSGADKASPTAQPSSETTRPVAELTPEALTTAEAIGGDEEAELGKLGKIAFVLGYDIWVMDADGSNVRNLTNNRQYNDQPAWSPDGRRIAFISNPEDYADIYVMEADGSNVVNLTRSDAADDTGPSWSPDGRLIAFSSSEADDDCGIYVMGADGSASHCLINGLADFPAWSPDGRHIAYIFSGGEGYGDVYVAASDGSGARPLTTFGEAFKDTLGSYGIGDPVWSPDGTLIAFSFSAPDDDESGIWVMNADGSDLHQIGAGMYPTWSPDGQYIAYLSPGGYADIWVMNADGSNARILETEGVGTELAWSPVP